MIDGHGAVTTSHFLTTRHVFCSGNTETQFNTDKATALLEGAGRYDLKSSTGPSSAFHVKWPPRIK